MPQGGKRKRSGGGGGGGGGGGRKGSRKAAQLEAKRRRKAGSQLKVGNPVRGVKKTGRFEMKSKGQKRISGKVNNNIEAIMAAKVLQMNGYLKMGDLQTVGKEKCKILKKLQLAKEKKHKKRHIKPEKVNVPRI
jgi:hypothetical protein